MAWVGYMVRFEREFTYSVYKTQKGAKISDLFWLYDDTVTLNVFGYKNPHEVFAKYMSRKARDLTKNNKKDLLKDEYFVVTERQNNEESEEE